MPYDTNREILENKSTGHLGLFLFTAIMLGLMATSALAVKAPIGEWEVRHGPLRIVYVFTPNGMYAYERSTSATFDEETGSYSVEGDILILQPERGRQRVLGWRIGPDEMGTMGLYLVDKFGRKEHFILNR